MDERSTDTSDRQSSNCLCENCHKGSVGGLGKREVEDEDLCLSGETDEEAEGEEGVEELVRLAQRERLGGCPALAAAYLAEAFSACQAQSRLLSKVSEHLGALLRRFFPHWHAPVAYFRLSLSILRSIDPSTSDAIRLTFELAKALISAEDCDEAEEVLAAVSTEVQAQVLLGRARRVRGELGRAESLLRQATAEARRQSDVALLAEAVGEFGQLLRDKEDYEEAARALWEAAQLKLELRSGDFSSLEGFAAVCVKLGRVQEVQSRLRETVATLRRTGSHPYIVADVLRILGDCLRPLHPEAAVTAYSEALEVCKAQKSASLHVAALLSRLVEVSPCTSMRSELSEVIDQLPDSAAIAHCCSTPQAAMKLMACVDSDPLSFEVGDMLLHLSQLCRQQPALRDAAWTRISAFLSRSPDSKLAGKLYASLVDWRRMSPSEKESTLRKAIEIHQHCKMSPSATASLLTRLAGLIEGRLATSLREKESYTAVLDCYEAARSLCQSYDPDSLPVSECLKRLAYFHTRRGELDHTETYLRQSLSIANGINPHSSKTAALLQDLSQLHDRRGDQLAAERCMRQSIDLYWRMYPGSYESQAAVGRLLALYDINDKQGEAMRLHHEYCEILRRTAPDKLPAQLLAFATFLSDRDRHSDAAKQYMDCILNCDRSAQLQAADALLSVQTGENKYGHAEKTTLVCLANSTLQNDLRIKQLRSIRSCYK